jgi:hypothetical protein
MRLFTELLGYHSNLNPLSILDDESPTTKSRREKGGLIHPLEPVQGESHQGPFDWHLKRSCDATSIWNLATVFLSEKWLYETYLS